VGAAIAMIGVLIPAWDLLRDLAAQPFSAELSGTPMTMLALGLVSLVLGSVAVVAALTD
jgi:hypothetical protein